MSGRRRYNPRTIARYKKFLATDPIDRFTASHDHSKTIAKGIRVYNFGMYMCIVTDSEIYFITTNQMNDWIELAHSWEGWHYAATDYRVIGTRKRVSLI